MSRTIDERTVSMKFDHDKFEQGVSSVMSALDKLKSKLNFSSNNFDALTRAANNVSFDGITRGSERVQASFSAMQVAAYTVISNITTKLMGMATSMARAFTIDPILTGFQEYETQINAIQTILSNTADAGTTMSDVTAALDTLNTYADKTIYNFTEMTRNIGTFTAAGVGLQDSVEAIQGIANLAAVSGSTSQQASTAMYQLSQALSQGYVMLMDWRSVVNAGMGGAYFKNALQETADQMLRFDEAYQQYWRENDKTNGYGSIQSLMEGEGGFRNSLQTLWMSSDVLLNTLRNLTETGANEYIAEHTRLVDADRNYLGGEILALRETAKESNNLEQAYHDLAAQLAETSDLTEEEIFHLLKNSTDAERAATLVKTLTQLFDTLKEAAQSGWTQSWEYIIGDFEEARELFTHVSDALGGVIGAFSDRRNTFLGRLLQSNWKQFSTMFATAGINVDSLEEHLADLSWRMGVNMDDFESFEDSLSANWIRPALVNRALRSILREMAEANGTVLEFTGNVSHLTREQLISVGMSDEQAEAFEALAFQLYDTDSELGNLMAHMDRVGGRTLIIETLSNVFGSLLKILKAIATAWAEIFPADNTDGAYRTLETIRDLSRLLVPTEETLDKIRRTFKGIFAVIDILWTTFKIIVGGIFRVGTRVLTRVFGPIFEGVEGGILGVTANIGDAIVRFRDWLKENDRLGRGIRAVWHVIKAIFQGIGALLRSIWESPFVQSMVNRARNAFSQFATDAAESFRILRDEGLRPFLESIGGIANLRFSNLRDLFGIIWNWAKTNVFGRVSEGVGNFLEYMRNFRENIGNVIERAANGLAGFRETIAAFVQFVKDHASQIAAGVFLASVLIMLHNIGKALRSVTGVIEGFGKVLESFAGVMDSFAGYLRAQAFRQRARGILELAIAVGIIAAAIFVLTKINAEPQKVAGAVAAVGIIFGALIGLMFAMNAFDKGNTAAIGKFTLTSKNTAGQVLMLAASLVLIALALSRLSKIPLGSLGKSLLIMLGAIGGLALIAGLLGRFSKRGARALYGAKAVVQLALSLMTVSLALLIISKMSLQNAAINAAFLLSVILVMVVISRIMKTLEKGQKGLNPLLSMSLSLVVIAIALKMLNKLDLRQTLVSLTIVMSILFMFMLITIATAAAGKYAAGAGIAILMMTAAIVVLTIAIKKLAEISNEDLARGFVIITAFFAIFTAIMALTAFAGPFAMRAGVMLIAMSASIIILVGAIYLLSLLNGVSLAQPVACISALMIVMGFAIAMSHFGGKAAVASIIVFTMCITLLVGMVVALTFIDADKALVATVALSLIMGAFIAFSIALMEMSKYTQNMVNMMGNLVIMLFIVGTLGLLVAGISQVTDPTSAIATSVALSILLTTFAITLKILSTGLFASGKMAASIVAIAIMMGVVIGLALIIWRLTEMEHADRAIDVTMALTELLMAFTQCFVVLSLIGILAPAAVVATAAMGAVLAIFAGVANEFGEFVGNVNMEQLRSGMAFMQELATNIGAMIGNFVGGLASALTSHLPEIGTNLSLFALSIMPFLQVMKGIDEDVVTGVDTLCRAMVILAGAQIVNVIASIFGGSVGDYAAQFNAFGDAIVDFAKKISSVSDWSPTETAARSIATLMTALRMAPTEGGLLEFAFGHTSMDQTLEGLSDLGDAIVSFSETVSEVSDWGPARNASAALRNIFGALEGAPTEGGLLNAIFGSLNFSNLSNGMLSLGTALKYYNISVSDISSWDSINSSIEPLRNLFIALKDAPETGGLLGKLIGDEDFPGLASGMKQIGEALSAYSQEISEASPDWSLINDSSSALTNLFTAMSEAPNSDGILGDILGNQDYSMLAGSFGDIGDGLRAFSDSIQGVSTTRLSTAADSVNILAGVGAQLSMNGNAGATLEAFGSRLSTFGVNLGGFFTNTEEIEPDRLRSIASAIVDFVNEVGSIEGDEGGGVAEVADEVNTSVDSISDTIEEEGPEARSAAVNFWATVNPAFDAGAQDFVNNAEEYGTDAINSIPEGINEGVGHVTGFVRDRFGNLIDTTIGTPEHMKIAEDRGKNVGRSSGQGMIEGAREKLAQVEQVGRELGSALDRGTRSKRGLDVNSPSRVLYRTGVFGVLGFINAFRDNIGATEAAGRDAANSAVDGFSSSLNRMKLMSDIIDSGFDLTPVITPVVDLSNVRKGADAINAMMSTSKAYGVAGGFGAYGIQNGDLNRNTTNVFNITNNVAENTNPEAWALSFAKGLQRKVRMGG